jgi:hypothetical protein
MLTSSEVNSIKPGCAGKPLLQPSITRVAALLAAARSSFGRVPPRGPWGRYVSAFDAVADAFARLRGCYGWSPSTLSRALSILDRVGRALDDPRDQISVLDGALARVAVLSPELIDEARRDARARSRPAELLIVTAIAARSAPELVAGVCPDPIGITYNALWQDADWSRATLRSAYRCLQDARLRSDGRRDPLADLDRAIDIAARRDRNAA